MELRELEVRDAAVARLDVASARLEAARYEQVRAWEELRHACLAMVFDHAWSITRTAEVSGAHRNTVKHWVQFERELRARVGEATPVPAE